MGIYKITNTKNGKFYIGSSNNIDTRWSSHRSCLDNHKHPNNYLQHAWDLYGRINFALQIIEDIYEEKDLIPREQFFIDTTKCCDHNIGYNIRPSADRSALSEETKIKIGLANKGKVPWITGKHHKAETRIKLSNINKIKNHMRGKNGEKHHFYGQKHTDETKRKMSLAKKGKLNNHSSKPVCQMDENFNIIKIFPSINEAERQLGIEAKNIGAVLKGKKHRPRAGGFRWKWK